MSKVLKQNYQENIDNYQNEIKQLTNFVDIVRQMPGMYIGLHYFERFLLSY